MFHALLDQLNVLKIPADYQTHIDIRQACVSNFIEMLETEAIIWIDDEDMNDWIDRMCKPEVFGDQYCLQIFANLVNRDIIYIPVYQSLAHIINNYCIVNSSNSCHQPPITLL